MVGEDGGEGAVFRAIVEGPRAWADAGRIAEDTGLTIENANACLAVMAEADLVAEWPGFGWTLTPYAASSINVSLREDGLTGRAYWGNAPVPSRRPSLRARRATDLAAAALAEVPDPGPGPAELAEAAEPGPARAWSPARAFDPNRLPWPSVVLTGSATGWSERPALVFGKKAPDRVGARRFDGPKPRHVPVQSGVCPACKDSHLSTSTYCLRCDRWGFDGVCAARRRAALKAAAHAAEGSDRDTKAKGQAGP